jgi:cell wall-associated NlpC family hydrolase
MHRPRPPAWPWLLVAALGAAWLFVAQPRAEGAGIHLAITTGLPASAPTTTVTTQPTPASRLTPPSTATRPSASAARAVAFALAQRGKPYVWGAEGPDAYDCSGLTFRAWQDAGLLWERMTAAGQWRYLRDPAHGHPVPASQLQPGDLLFYAADPHDPASIHHAAMAIGAGRMVEAYAPGVPVRTTSIRWSGFYAAARPIKAPADGGHDL